MTHSSFLTRMRNEVVDAEAKIALRAIIEFFRRPF